MSAERNFTDQDYELLSAYIDDALAQSEREALESRLRTDARLQRELDSLRQTVRLINQLPTLRAPRDFTLDESMVGAAPARKTIHLFPAAFSELSAAAAVILFMFGGYFLLRQPAPPMTMNADMIAAAPTISRATTFMFSATSAVAMEEAAADTGADVPPLDADGSVMRSLVTPDETQVKLDDSANMAAGAAPAQATSSPAATNAPAEEAESAALSEMTLEPLPTATAADIVGEMAESDSFAAEMFDTEIMSAVPESTGDDSQSATTANDVMPQSAPETGDSSLSAPAPAVAQVPLPQPTAVEITPVSAVPDDRLFGLVLLAVGAVCLGLAVITLLYRRRSPR